MKIKWIIQDVNMRFSRLNDMVDALDALNYEYINFGIIPFTKSITNLENILEKDTIYIALSGVKLLTLLQENNSLKDYCEFLSEDQINNNDYYVEKLKNSVFYDIQKFDQSHYGKLGLPLLNDDAKYITIKDNLNLSFDTPKFVKPAKDLKAFNGGILEAGETFEHFIKNQLHQAFYIDENMVVADLKQIFGEYRFFIVNKEVVSFSQYKLGQRVVSSPVVPSFIIEKAKEYAKLYQPADIFTLDLADTDQGVKIVEYNCFNASGSYACDLIKTYKTINDYILKKYS